MGGWICCLLPFSATQAAQPVTAIARTIAYQPHYIAYAEVVPTRPLVLRAGQSGDIESLHLLPGAHLRAGEIVAKIGGPAVTAALRQAAATLNGARQRKKFAADALLSAQRTYPSFTSRIELDNAKIALALARTQLANARSALASWQQRIVLRSPAAGQITQLLAANGERIPDDAPILKMIPAGNLWLLANYYGGTARKFKNGLGGRFIPANGMPSIPVHVISRIPELLSDGSQRIGLESTGSADWESGERGQVVLYGRRREVVSIPTSALIFDQGHWWVLTLNQGQPGRTRVTPGPAQGSQTIILSGLTAGDQVVVQDAYLIFHRDFAAHYTPPD